MKKKSRKGAKAQRTEEKGFVPVMYGEPVTEKLFRAMNNPFGLLVDDDVARSWMRIQNGQKRYAAERAYAAERIWEHAEPPAYYVSWSVPSRPTGTIMVNP